MRRLWLLVGLLVLVAAAATSSGAQSPDILVDGGFEAGGQGWAPPSGAILSVDGASPVHTGAAAAHLSASGPGAVALVTQYWLVPVEPLAEHTLRVWVYADDPGLGNLAVALEFLDAGGAVVGGPATVR